MQVSCLKTPAEAPADTEGRSKPRPKEAHTAGRRSPAGRATKSRSLGSRASQAGGSNDRHRVSNKVDLWTPSLRNQAKALPRYGKPRPTNLLSPNAWLVAPADAAKLGSRNLLDSAISRTSSPQGIADQIFGATLGKLLNSQLLCACLPNRAKLTTPV